MSRWTWTALALPFVACGVGLLLAIVIPAPRGAEHHCPGGVPRSACFYSPNQVGWDVAWSVGGFVIGLIGGISYWAARRARANGKAPPW